MKNSSSLYFIFIALMLTVSMGFESKTPTPEHYLKQPKRLPPGDYLHWVEDSQNGLITKTTVGALDFMVQFKPLDYIVLKESQGHQDVLTKKLMDERKSEINGLEYYAFFISLNNGKKDVVKTLTNDMDEYDQVIRYFAGGMQRDLKLIAGVDTLECKLFHFERTYGVTSYARFEIGFDPAKRKFDRTIIFNAQAINAEAIELTIKSNDLENIPQVNF